MLASFQPDQLKTGASPATGASDRSLWGWYRRRSEFERRCQVWEEQQKQLAAQTDRREELVGLSRSIEDFCQRIRQGLEQATFEHKRHLVELLIDRVMVTDVEVEIRYVMPTAKSSERSIA